MSPRDDIEYHSTAAGALILICAKFTPYPSNDNHKVMGFEISVFLLKWLPHKTVQLALLHTLKLVEAG